MKAWLTSRLFPSSLRGRLMVLVALAVLPALIVVLWTAYKQRLQGLEHARESTLRLARLAGGEHDRLIESSRQLLATLAQLREVKIQDVLACQALFTNLLQVHRIYANIAAARPNGEIFAAGLDDTNRLTFAKAPFFSVVTNERRFVIGDYVVDRQTRKATVEMGYPVLADGREGRLIGVVVAALDLEWLYGFHADAKLPEDSSFTVFDSRGLTLARRDRQFIGDMLPRRPQPGPPEEAAAPVAAVEGTRVLPGRDETMRLYGYTALGTNMADRPVRISVGIPLSSAHATADSVLRQNLIFLGLAAALAFVAAWFGSEAFILRKVRSLLKATGRLQEGDLSARIAVGSGQDEFGQLAQAFNEMATALEKQFAERAHAEEALRRLNLDLEQRVADRTRKLKRSNEDLEQFAYVASHDLQEPLRMVTSYLDLIRKRYGEKLDQNAREFIEFAVDGAERMHRLINDLLAFSRIESRAQPFGMVDCNQVVDRVLKNLRVVIEESHARIECEPLPTIPGDASQLTQLFQNVVSNAVKFRSQQPVQVRIKAERDQAHWIFSVQDNGIGISPKHFERIFLIFQRLHGRDKYTGSGIGLAICKKITERHSGHIWVKSDVGRGSTFYIRLPASQDPGTKTA